MTAFEIEIIVVLYGAAEESLARIATQSAKMVALGDIPTDAAIFRRLASAASCFPVFKFYRRLMRHLREWQLVTSSDRIAINFGK